MDEEKDLIKDDADTEGHTFDPDPRQPSDQDEGDVEGLSLFYRLAAEDGLIEEARPLEFLGPG